MAKFGDDREIKTRADYMAAIALFCGQETTRYYLEGVLIEPHPVRGITLTATDGHRIGSIYDPDGSANRSWICPFPEIARPLALRDRMLTFAGHRMTISEGAVCHIATDSEPLDGKYPDWRAIIAGHAHLDATAGALGTTISADYLVDFGEAAKLLSSEGYSGVAVSAPTRDGPMFIRLRDTPDFMGVLMPMPLSGIYPTTMRDNIPAWFSMPAKQEAAA